jgi:hypothetical protein
MLEICQILLIFLTLCGVGVVLMARASLAQLGGYSVIALEGCVRMNGSWHDAATYAWPLLSWNSAHRPPPGPEGLSPGLASRRSGSACGVLSLVSALAPCRRI